MRHHKLPDRAENLDRRQGKLRYVVEQSLALLHHFKRLGVRWERRTELHDAFVSLVYSLICRRRPRSRSPSRLIRRAGNGWQASVTRTCIRPVRCAATVASAASENLRPVSR
jgi:hypothetical protein